MKIALFQGLVVIHNEMIGYIIEYLINSKYDFDIYAHVDFTLYNNDKTIVEIVYKIIDNNIICDLCSEWKLYYETFFLQSLKWYAPLTFNPELYDLIFVLTDDDSAFHDEWLNNYGHKIILIEHHNKIRRPQNIFNRIGVRFFNSRPLLKWILPCYNGISINNKQQIQNNKINVSCVGTQNIPPSVEFLRLLFNNFDDITFHIIAYDIKNDLIADNIKLYPLCTTVKMFEVIKLSQYILFIHHQTNGCDSCKMSGAIPIAFSYGCQIIIPELWQQYYSFKSAITYKDNYIQNNGLTKLTLSLNTQLELVYNELYEMINHKNIVLDNIIYQYCQNNNTINNIHCIPLTPYKIIINKLSLSNPKIVVINNYENNLQYDFREVHIKNIDDFNKCKLNNCYLYNNIDYKHIKEPLLRVYNSLEISPNDINLISLRSYNDIIIINNNNDDNNDDNDDNYYINNLLKVYSKNKYYSFYNYNNMKLIIPIK